MPASPPLHTSRLKRSQLQPGGVVPRQQVRTSWPEGQIQAPSTQAGVTGELSMLQVLTHDRDVFG